MTKKRLLICIGQDLYDLLVAEKKRTGASMAEVVRRAIRKYFGK